MSITESREMRIHALMSKNYTFLNSKNEADLLVHIEFRINFVHRMHTDFIYYIPIVECCSDRIKIPSGCIRNDEANIKKIELFSSYLNNFQSLGVVKVLNNSRIHREKAKNLLISTKIRNYLDLENYSLKLIKQDNHVVNQESSRVEAIAAKQSQSIK